MIIRIVAFLLIFGQTAFSQQITQTIRGKVIDTDTQEPLIGAQVSVVGLEKEIGTVTDIDGNYELENVPVGRRTVECRYIGYTVFRRDNIQLISAKSYLLDIALKAGVDVAEVVVEGYQPNEAVNEIAVLSIRRLDPEELQLHAATANDPSRLVTGLPGVQPAWDVRNEVVIRGNSPIGVLWRLEGIDIPNPNHYAGAGSSGGGITIFSAGMLGSSDFSTGAFTSEFGNALSGVFDMRFRNGNLHEREHAFRAGILGIDLATEGPIKKGKSSYLANFRYSTLGILNAMDIHLIGPRTDNNFYDFSFKLHHQGKKSKLSLWGIGGVSFQNQRAADQPWTTFSDTYVYDSGANTGIIGGSWKQLIDDKSYVQTNFAYMGQRIYTFDDTLGLEQNRVIYENEDYTTTRLTLSSFYKRTFSPQFNMKVGTQATSIGYDLSFIARNDQHEIYPVIDATGNTYQLQPYMQFSYRPTQRFTLNFGVHSLFFGLNNTSNIEPRIGARYQLTDKSTLSASYGLHSKTLPLGSYFTIIDGATPHLDLELIKSHHFILAYDQLFASNLRFHIEGYYQRLYDVPVVDDPIDKVWLLNKRWGYETRQVIGGGTGENIGVDVYLEKFFAKGTFFILSGSLFNSTFQVPNDPVKYNTRYNANYSANLTSGQLFPINENTSIEAGLRFIYNNGMPISPLVAGTESIDGARPQEDLSQPYTLRAAPYFRPDMRIAFRKNGAKTSYWIALDIQNFINKPNNNPWYYVFNSETGVWNTQNQSPLTPILQFWVDF